MKVKYDDEYENHIIEPNTAENKRRRARSSDKLISNLRVQNVTI